MKSYRPAAGWIFVQAEQIAETSAGGIVKPQSAIDKERALGAESAPSFRVLATGAESFGPDACNYDYAYPAVGSKVFVLNLPMSIVTISVKEGLIFVKMDAVVGTVTEENA